jgi:hypothetical protein
MKVTLNRGEGITGARRKVTLSIEERPSLEPEENDHGRELASS